MTCPDKRILACGDQFGDIGYAGEFLHIGEVRVCGSRVYT